MAYRNTGTGPNQVTLTAPELATLKTYALLYPTQTNDVIARQANAPSSVPNPQPNALRIVLATFANVYQLTTQLSALQNAAIAANPAQAADWQFINSSIVTLLNLHVATQTAINLDSSEISNLAGPALALNNPAVTQASIAAALYIADPAIPATIPAPSWAYTNLSGAWVTAADVAAALAS